MNRLWALVGRSGFHLSKPVLQTRAVIACLCRPWRCCKLASTVSCTDSMSSVATSKGVWVYKLKNLKISLSDPCGRSNIQVADQQLVCGIHFLKTRFLRDFAAYFLVAQSLTSKRRHAG